MALISGLVAIATLAAAANDGVPTSSTEAPVPVADGQGIIISSSSSAGPGSLAARETASLDTFVLYGGPDRPTEGKFQMADGVAADWGGGNGLPGGPYGGGPNAWQPVDLTGNPVYWHVSTYNAGNLNGHGAGNKALWSGVDAGDPQGLNWVHTPGYGNGWYDATLYTSPPVADPTTGEVVTLDFFFNHDTEPAYDYFVVEYDSAGIWTTVYSVDGSNADTVGMFQAPGVQYSTVATSALVYAGYDYGGINGDRIRIRFLVTSDVAYSDEDGLWRSNAGAVQVDDITISSSLGMVTEDFEGGGPYLFNPDVPPFAGDFADVYPRITDVDPCRENTTPVAGFIDYNQIVRNGPAPDGTVQTGGSLNPAIAYGIPGNWVVNSSGGISFGLRPLKNEIWSPEILWDLPGPDDDDSSIAGAVLQYSVWADLPLSSAIFYVWHVRSARAGEAFNNWSDRRFVYFGGGERRWLSDRFDVSDLLRSSPERVQIALGAWDMAGIFGFPPGPGRPSPCFDNVTFLKYRVGGPVMSTRTIDLAQDGFPVSGSVDVSDQASRDALDIPFSMARDINTYGISNTAGDSIIVDVASRIPGATVTDIRMAWALQTNAAFEDALRQAPARARDQNVVAGPAGSVWSGEVVADSSTTVTGLIVENRYFVGLPDADFMYPGDVLHYYIQATDSDGRVTTLPTDTSDFGVFGPDTNYDRKFTVRGLPSITDTTGSQPEILVINDFGRRGVEGVFTTALRQFGYLEGVDYDTYTVQGPTSMVSNGIGSAGVHGANAGQLGGYQYVLYFSGNLSTGLLSNGSDMNGNDKGDDIGVLEQWHGLDPGINRVRSVAYFGDFIASALVFDSPEGLTYLGNTMGVNWVDDDVRDAIGGQTAPLVQPSGFYPDFRTKFIAYGGCPTINRFDQIQPLVGSGVGHYFTDPSGAPITDINAGVASVVHPTTYGVDLTYPYSLASIQDVVGRSVGVSTRAILLQESLYLLGVAPTACDPCTAAPAALSVDLNLYPNPFNPATTVSFTAAIGSRGYVKVFSLRGELVRTLHSGEFQTRAFRWDGTDDRGAAVASGVYLIRATTDGQVMTVKAALVK